jgi:hypothetical protein
MVTCQAAARRATWESDALIAAAFLPSRARNSAAAIPGEALPEPAAA